jgi:hypothetical protein
MDPAEMLGTAAQVTVTIAGFAGVVVVFGKREVHAWSAVDRLRLSHLLGTSLMPLVLCLFGLLLLSTGLEQPTVWRLGSAVAALSFVLNGASLRTFRRIPQEELAASDARKRLFYSTTAIALAAMLLQIYNIVALHAFWPFFATIVMSITVSTLQFALMVVARRQSA